MDDNTFESFVQAYWTCALWSSTEYAEPTSSDGEPEEIGPMDANYGIGDIEAATLEEGENDCRDFVLENLADLIAYCANHGQSMSQAGHDFWLTRNGHGAGFWDRGLGALGDRLSDAAKVYGSVDLYVTADGTVLS